MFRYLRILFYAYVILLALYVSVNSLLHRRWSEAQVTYTPMSQECFQGGQSWDYCVHRSAQTDRRAILYVLHGKNGNAQMWMSSSGYPALLQKYWQEDLASPPIIVTVSFGPVWLAKSSANPSTSGVLETFQSEVFKVVEDRVGRPQRRHLLGESMGALNVLALSLSFPKSFNKVAALCPPLFNESPFDEWSTWQSFLMRTGAKPKDLVTLVTMGRKMFKDDQEWRSFSPMDRVQSASFTKSQHFYISAGLKDGFGLFEGTEQFIKSLKRSGARVHWRPNSGRHCSVDIPSLARFLDEPNP
jgi:S-formylglutathione hydrolase FrmB